MSYKNNIKYSTSVLEFNKVIDVLLSYASSDLAKVEISSREIITNKIQLQRDFDIVEEFLLIKYKLGDIPLGGLYNIVDCINRAKIGSVLSCEEFINIVSIIDCVSNNIRFLSDLKSENIETKYYFEFVNNLIDLKALKSEIKKCISDTGEVLSSASQNLSKIRKEISNKENNLRQKVNQLVSSNSSKLNDSIYTLKNNRYCLPVKVEFKNTFSGTILGESASGETIYIEPSIIGNIQNDIDSLLNEEKTELNKILSFLTKSVGDNFDSLESNLLNLVDLDVYMSMSKFAYDYNCVKPTISDYTNLIDSRHPLLNQSDIVSNTITIGKQFKCIIITGPNTGGKTIVLKTLGVLSLMAQYGMLIPVAEGSTIKIYDSIMADMGDEQSIEKSLSTFSSHIENIKVIIKESTKNSLVIFDELGSGTDPKEGSCLAISIIKYFIKRDTNIIASTHYSDLKSYAFEKDHILNASVEFDSNTLKPTYKLLLGIPGKSNALQICKRLGLNEEIIEDASKHYKSMDTTSSKIIEKLELKAKEYNDLISEQKTLLKNIYEQENVIKDSAISLENERQSIIEAAKKESESILKEAKDKADSVVKELKKMKEKSFKDHEITDVLTSLKEEDVKFEKTNFDNIEVGDNVKVLNLQLDAEVLEIKNNKYKLKIGKMTSYYKVDEIELVTKKQNKKSKIKTSSKVVSKIAKSYNNELDLRAKRYEEAYDLLDKFLDQCVYSNIKQARIVHGFGTGVIRELVQKTLKKCKHISNFRYGGAGEGLQGVTIVNFK